jgi:hypothetical protein
MKLFGTRFDRESNTESACWLVQESPSAALRKAARQEFVHTWVSIGSERGRNKDTRQRDDLAPSDPTVVAPLARLAINGTAVQRRGMKLGE